MGRNRHSISTSSSKNKNRKELILVPTAPFPTGTLYFPHGTKAPLEEQRPSEDRCCKSSGTLHDRNVNLDLSSISSSSFTVKEYNTG